MGRQRAHGFIWAAAAVIGPSAPASAQVPNVGFVFPSGGQVGQKATVNISGANLQGATQVLLSGTGVQAQITKNTEAGALPVELTIAPDALPGMREVRVVTPRGTSNAGRIWLAAYPDTNEVEPNSLLSQAQKLEKLPAVINGQINGGEDVDCFTFRANAGETFVFDLVANRMASGLDGYVGLFDSRGKIVQSALEGFDRDPRLIHTFKTAGAYTLQVRDSMYRGGGNFTYRLTMGKVPAVTGMYPMGGKRGQMVTVNLEGVNLGDMKSMPVQIPADGDEVTVPVSTPLGAATAPLSFTAGNLDEAVENEPNDAPAQATAVAALPVILNGRINKAGDIDLYRIKPAAAGNLSFEVNGRRIGSRIDSFLRVLDATGKEVQSNDDAEGKDSRITFAVAAGTEYLVEVRTIDRRFGGDVFYRLSIDAPAGQDFALTMTPTEINVGQSGSAVVTVNVLRRNGFAGAVPLKVEGLPAGVTASPALIPAGAASAQFTVTAEPGATPGAMNQFRVIGAATIAEKPVERVAQPVEIFKPPLAADGQNQQRRTLILPATVMPQQAYALNIEPKAATVKKGQPVTIKITAVRAMGTNQAITIAAAGQPANVTPALQPIPQDKTETTLTLTVAANAPTVTQNVIITGNLANNIQAAPAFTLTITD
ncbi:MAG: hypothetical protein ACO1SX_21680 [Actinomycetota bacterium]